MTVVAGFITSIIVLLIYIAIAKQFKLFERRKQEKLKQEFFVQNKGDARAGGVLLRAARTRMCEGWLTKRPSRRDVPRDSLSQEFTKNS